MTWNSAAFKALIANEKAYFRRNRFKFLDLLNIFSIKSEGNSWYFHGKYGRLLLYRRLLLPAAVKLYVTMGGLAPPIGWKPPVHSTTQSHKIYFGCDAGIPFKLWVCLLVFHHLTFFVIFFACFFCYTVLYVIIMRLYLCLSKWNSVCVCTVIRTQIAV